MLLAIHGVKLYAQCFMFIAVHKVKHYAHFYTRSEALCSLLYKELSYVLIAIYGVKLYTHCYT